MKRTFDFYRKNEKEVMHSLGLQPTKNSGSGWIEKEDGQNDYVICQLKSTDAQSIKVNQKDIRILEKNARIEHKYPLFAIQFLNTGEVWLMVKPEDLTSVSEYLTTGKTTSAATCLVDLSASEELPPTKGKTIKSAASARDSFHSQKQEKYKKHKSAR